jgi:hypothetical protein
MKSVFVVEQIGSLIESFTMDAGSNAIIDWILTITGVISDEWWSVSRTPVGEAEAHPHSGAAAENPHADAAFQQQQSNQVIDSLII